MTPNQARAIILLIQTVDWLLVLGLMAYLAYAYNKTYSPTYILTVALVGLFFIHLFGQWSITKIAFFRAKLKRLETVPHVR